MWRNPIDEDLADYTLKRVCFVLGLLAFIHVLGGCAVGVNVKGGGVFQPGPAFDKRITDEDRHQLERKLGQIMAD